MIQENLLKFAFQFGHKQFDLHKLLVSDLRKKNTNTSNIEPDFSNAKIEETLRHKFHPKQIVFCNEFSLTFCEAEYSYTTNRGNKRTGTKILVFSSTDMLKGSIQDNLEKWCESYNKNNQYRQISNINLINSRYSTDIGQFLNVHPKQLIICSWDLNLSFFKINYTHNKPQKAKKESSKIFVYTGGINPQRDMKEQLSNWIEMFNIQNPKKSLLNVKFLKSESLGYIGL